MNHASNKRFRNRHQITLRYQRGLIPIAVLVALLAASLIGGFIGFQLGDGTFFSAGIGIGIVLVMAKLLSPYFDDLKKLVENFGKR